jgi:hypothetical protein
MRNLLILLLVLALASCSIPFGKKADKTSGKPEKRDTIQESSEPKPGDVKLIDGVEYIFAKNRRWHYTPYEPEYIWVRKDQYSPGLFESITGKLLGGTSNKQEREELEKRIARLEDDLKKKGSSVQVAPQQGFSPMPGATFSYVGAPAFTFSSPKMKRRVLLLPLVDQTNYKEEHLEELTTKRLVARLENTGTIICVDPRSTDVVGDLSTPQAMKALNELYGVQAVVKGSLSDVYITTSRPQGKDGQEVSFALSKISLDIYNTETTKLLRQLSVRNPFALTREKGDMSPERAKIKAIDLAIELVADDLLKALLTLDWHARIATIENEKVFVNAGRLSGLEKGDILEVYAPGDQIIDKTTNIPLGRTRGNYKGEIEVFEVFGVDASWAKARKVASFAPTDLVYLKK